MIPPEIIKQYKLLAQLEKTELWVKGLKPFLENKKQKVQISKKEYATSFEAARADIKRATTLTVVDDIIDSVEKANERVSNNYQGD